MEPTENGLDAAAEHAEPPGQIATDAPSSDGTKKKKKKKKKSLGSAKGLETMYRNAYRAELDLISLAAVKANIMISINGFIISVLIVSGGFIYSSSPLFLLPATLFLFTSAASVFFALLAASPENLGRIGRGLQWMKDVMQGNARLRDFRSALHNGTGFVEGTSNVLIYEDKDKLSKEEFQIRMAALSKDQEAVYASMNDQLYWLGNMASTKFRMLRRSYGVFRWGLVLSVLAFLSVRSVDALLILDGDQVVQLRNVGVSRFDDLYEPSAGVQLPDGRILMLEDEAERAFNILTFQADGGLVEDAALDRQITASFGRDLSDLEGLTVGDDDYVYATTSHSTTKEGNRVAAREEMVRFRVDDDQVTNVAFLSDLRNRLQNSPTLQQGLAERIGTSGASLDEINIEGLTYNRDTGGLMIGFRQPVIDGLSLVVTIANPDEVFGDGVEPQFEDVALLPLDGGGIRSMNFDPVIDAFMLVNEVEDESGRQMPRLWAWSGVPTDRAFELQLPGMVNLDNVESIDSVEVNGQSRLLISSDDGDVDEDRPASYMLLDQDQLFRELPPE